MTTLDVSVRASSTFNRTRPALRELAWNRRTIGAERAPWYIGSAIRKECVPVATKEEPRPIGRSAVAVVIRVVAP